MTRCMVGLNVSRLIIGIALCVFCFASIAPAIAAGEPGIIKTPPASPKPRINGARVFGVRPGRPFLYTIPATGERPMNFSVENLPAGLQVNPKNGQISGVIKEAGEYRVTFHASNGLGTAARDFKIVCGETLALTPHMGWNSWYVWESRVTDKIMRDAADAMVANGMINHGYQYVNIDDCWAVSCLRRTRRWAARSATRRER